MVNPTRSKVKKGTFGFPRGCSRAARPSSRVDRTEAVGNGGPRWMTARSSDRQNPAYRPTPSSTYSYSRRCPGASRDGHSWSAAARAHQDDERSAARGCDNEAEPIHTVTLPVPVHPRPKKRSLPKLGGFRTNPDQIILSGLQFGSPVRQTSSRRPLNSLRSPSSHMPIGLHVI